MKKRFAWFGGALAVILVAAVIMAIVTRIDQAQLVAAMPDDRYALTGIVPDGSWYIIHTDKGPTHHERGYNVETIFNDTLSNAMLIVAHNPRSIKLVFRDIHDMRLHFLPGSNSLF